MRKVISIILGLALLIAGLWGFFYMLTNSGSVKILFWMVPIGSFGIGLAILWEDVSSILKRGENER
ncbi:hypothetical protein F4V91_07420 [Neorhizobium galegae]|uniref:Uncharacterized protein n=1 Tax=Neorhizobium galegae TaxID=399 RepID=A0A6A1TP90_NEOGA|nr:hypothetical protein F4V91_07420 [Neorhizobium galegae]